MSKPYEIDVALDGEAFHGGGFDGSRVHPQITYKASCRDSRGLGLGEAIIMLKLSGPGYESGWFDADHIAKNVNEYRESLIEKLDEDWVPNAEGDKS